MRAYTGRSHLLGDDRQLRDTLGVIDDFLETWGGLEDPLVGEKAMFMSCLVAARLFSTSKVHLETLLFLQAIFTKLFASFILSEVTLLAGFVL